MDHRNVNPIRYFRFAIRVSKIMYIYFLNLVFWKKPKKRFIIFAQGRTGSTLLVDLLNQVDGIHCEEEILSREFFPFNLKIPFPFAYLRGHEIKNSKSYFGFKLKIYHLTEHLELNPEKVLKHFTPGYKFIYLYRDDIPSQVISNLLGYHNKKYHLNRNESFEFKKFSVSNENFVKRIERRKTYRVLESELMSNLDHISISYESDLIDEKYHQNTVDKICNFLGIESGRVSARTRKSNVFHPSEVIENFDEIESTLKDYLRTLKIAPQED